MPQKPKKPKKGPAPAAPPAAPPPPFTAEPVAPFVPLEPGREWDAARGRYQYDRPVSAAELVVTEQEWLWQPFLPRGLMSLIVGDSGAGKSTLLAYVAASVSAGREMCGRGGNPIAKVLYYTAEDDAGSTVRPRLVAAGAILRHVYFGGIGRDGRPVQRMLLPNDLNKLSEAVKELGVALVILDPVTAYLSGGIDQNKDQQVRLLLDGLCQIADETGCTILCTKNYRKSRDGGPLDWVGGAPAWTQVPRVVLACGFDPDDATKRVMACSKNSLTKIVRSKRYELVDREGVGAWVGGAECDLTAEDMGAGGMTPGERDALGDAVAFLLDELGPEERTAKIINSKAEDFGISRGTLRRAKAKLGITSHPIGPNAQRDWVWRLPVLGGPQPAVPGA